MGHFEQAMAALAARRFHEAQAHLNEAAVEGAPATQVHAAMFKVARELRPEESWRELETWTRFMAQAGDWDAVATTLEEHGASVPAVHAGFVHELVGEFHHRKGEHAKAFACAVLHCELLHRKKVIPGLLKYALLYRHRFPRTITFIFHAAVVHAWREDFSQAERAMGEYLEALRSGWRRLEDVTPEGRASFLAAMYEAITPLDPSDGRFAFLTHGLRWHRIIEGTQQPRPEDWKKLLELVVRSDAPETLRLVLKAAVRSGDQALAEETLQLAKRKRGFSPQVFARHDPELKEWLLRRSQGADAGTVAQTLTSWERWDGEPQERVTTSTSPVPTLDAEERAMEENALAQMRLLTPTATSIPDLIVAYRALGFGRVVDWLLARPLGDDCPPLTRRKVQYLAVLHAMEQGSFHLALACVTEMLGSRDLGIEELGELKYVQAAIHRKLGDDAGARRLFAEVDALRPGYRRAREGAR